MSSGNKKVLTAASTGRIVTQTIKGEKTSIIDDVAFQRGWFRPIRREYTAWRWVRRPTADSLLDPSVESRNSSVDTGCRCATFKTPVGNYSNNVTILTMSSEQWTASLEYKSKGL